MLTKNPTSIGSSPEQNLDPTFYPEPDPETGPNTESIPATEPDAETNEEPTLPPEVDPEFPSKPV
ncbi:hypothetical protein [Chroococcus sp. FPU101]|uniref:hypothetical protein n=1 Tax=Chroococcus sp. FPU101 TaxID=1974212 RepID=UPI001A8CE22F|nr:hypothetical protein [Chroococcus sp. FPU101]GFE72231.1 hypothetical protein CFPU101_48410 [Chroococcus sp. FPU101]